VAALAGLEPVAHGGVAGAIAESFLALAIGGVLLAIRIRERRGGRTSDGPARLRDEDES
jgi:hypothetical protein